MDVTTINIIISAVVGLLSGAIGSLIAPWINWNIEKRKILLNRKVELLNKLRSYLNHGEYANTQFRETDLYSQIRLYLTQELIKQIERGSNHHTLKLGGRGGGVDNFKAQILDEINRIEKEWGLH